MKQQLMIMMNFSTLEIQEPETGKIIYKNGK